MERSRLLFERRRSSTRWSTPRVCTLWRVAGVLICCSIWQNAGEEAGQLSQVQELHSAVLKGGHTLRSFLERVPQDTAGALLSAVNAEGYSALAVAAYACDAEATQLLLDKHARVVPGSLNIYLNPSDPTPGQVGSLVELVVRRGAMLIMLGTHFYPPKALRSTERRLLTSRRPSRSDPEVADVAGTLELLVRVGGARPTDKSLEEGSDLARAAYYLDAGCVEVLAKLHGDEVDESQGRGMRFSRAAGRALVAAVLGSGQLKHRLNRALMSQPRMAGRLFRDYYGFDIASEATLLEPTLHGFSFEDTARMVQGKALRVVRSLLEDGRADPSFRQSKRSQKTALHTCAEHGLTALAESLLAHRADTAVRSQPMSRTPLHVAAIHRSTGVVRALLAAGADAQVADDFGSSPADIAKLLRWEEGQRLFGVPDSEIARPPNPPTVLGVGELLPSGWRSRMAQGNMGQSWANHGGNKARGYCAIDIVQPENLTLVGFVRNYLSVRRPALIPGGASYMPALERWANLRYLKRKAGDTQVSAGTIPYPEDFGDHDVADARQISLGNYIDEVMGKVNSTSGTPLYVFSVVERDDGNFKKLLNLVEKDAWPHPSWLSSDTVPQGKVSSGGQPRLRFGNTQFALGPSGSGAPQHYHTHAYASLFTGRKRWWFFPPPTSSLSRQHAVRFAAEDAEARLAALGVAGATVPGAAPLICEQLPGDIVYVPSEWGHATLNTGEHATLSVSREFTWDAEETDSHVINSLQI